MTETEKKALSPEALEMLEQLETGRARMAAMPSTGQRFALPRADKPPVDVLLYRPADKQDKPLPVVFNLHGGAWIGGDAMLMESFCALLAEKIPALVVNVNYKKADQQLLPYAEEELCDAVRYFAAHAAEYGIDPARMVVGGHSAGAHLAAGAALMLHDAGLTLAGQMLVYPPTDMRDRTWTFFGSSLFVEGGENTYWGSPLCAPSEMLQGLGPVLMIVCGPDSLRPQGLAYAERLQAAGVTVEVKDYPTAQHGFLEVNRPDYPAGDERQSPEQAALARDAEAWLIQQLQRIFA